MAHDTPKSTGLRTFIEGAQLGMDYQLAIALGQIAGHATFRAIGRRVAISTAVGGDDAWEGVAVAVPFPDQTVGEQMTLVSTDAQDSAAGTGAQQVRVSYLTAAGAEASEVVTMNGVAPVNMVATNIRFNQLIRTERVGALGAVAAGDVTIYRTGDAARIYNVIKAGGNVSLCAHRMVPAGKTLYINHIKADAVDNKPLSVRFRATCDFESVLTPNIFIFNEIFELQNSSDVMPLLIPRVFPALTIIKASIVATSAGGTASLSYGGWIE